MSVLPTAPVLATTGTLHDHDCDCTAAPLELVLDDGPAPPRAVLRATGELEAATADLLLDVVERAVQGGRTDVELDLGGVAFCDVRGIDAVLTARTRVRAAGGELHLCRVRPFLHHVLGVMRLGEVVTG
ncbi:STAS domain-containing protein [Kineococcus indalonis]|uniref:STAS domain-containing protein n=1 Tax=Kineococcus indalonis TaxID=2696566 RepID=UPI0014136193|nr:STAS domain-containing protein [Kineococcus indalonis]NAZ86869.1 STAS domain-containing protein [Kineococcus indalonis]